MEKVIDITERVPAMKKRRRRRTNFKFIALITLFLFIILLLLYFQSPFSDISKIDVSGAHLKEDEFYIKESTLKLNDSMWDFKVTDIEKKISENEWIKSVEVKRVWLNKVKISIEEWHKVAYISKDGILKRVGRVFGVDSISPAKEVVIENMTAEEALNELGVNADE